MNRPRSGWEKQKARKENQKKIQPDMASSRKWTEFFSRGNPSNIEGQNSGVTFQTAIHDVEDDQRPEGQHQTDKPTTS